MNYYIDAWCPADGMAFVSCREPDMQNVKETVYLAPPFFEPEHIASVATALASTRGHFQEGFYHEGQEIAFTSREEAIETVKRVYRAGGSAMQPPPEVDPRLPTKPSDVPPGGASPEQMVSQKLAEVWKDLHAILTGRFNVDRGTLIDIVHDFIECISNPASGTASLYVKFGLVLLTPILRGCASSTSLTHGQIRTMRLWADVFSRMGLLIHIAGPAGRVLEISDGGSFWFAEEIEELSLGWMRSGPVWEFVLGSRDQEVEITDLMNALYRTPLPPHWGTPFLLDKSRHPQVPNLGALLALAASDRLFYERFRSPLDFVPVVFCAIALTTLSMGRGSWALPREDNNDTWRILKRRSANWLAAALPIPAIKPTSVEDYIHAFALAALGVR